MQLLSLMTEKKMERLVILHDYLLALETLPLQRATYVEGRLK